MFRVLSVVAGVAALSIASVPPVLAAAAAPLGTRVPVLPVGGLLGVVAAAVIGGIYLTRRRD